MEGIVTEIKNKIDIVEVIGSYITLKKLGRNFKANCPFHQEKSPSFVVSPERQIWHCFGACNEGGDVIKFVMKWENITFYEALKELAVKAGIALQKVSFEDKEWEKKEQIFRINNLATEFYQYILQKTSFGKTALEYLASRSISPQIAQTFQMGYAPASWDSLLKFLKKKQFREEEVLASGLLIKNESNHYYDRFRGRLTFPIKDIRGNIIGFSGRVLESKAKEAKYINTPETTVYHKRESLFGIHIAKEHIRKEENVLLVEGEMDMISLYQHGIGNVVAVKGSAITQDHLKILKRLTPKITLALDADMAGQEAIKKAITQAEEMEFEVYVLDMEGSKDPDEAVRENAMEFKKKLKSPISVYDFIIKLAIKKNPEEGAFSKKKIGEEVIPFISAIKNPIIQSHYTKKLSSLLEVSDESVQSLFKKYAQKGMAVTQFLPKALVQKAESREELTQKYLLSYIFQHEKPFEAIEVVSKTVEPGDFSVVAYKKIFEQLIEYKVKTPYTTSLREFCNSLPPELQSVTDEFYLFNIDELQSIITGGKDESVKIEKMMLELKRSSLKKKISHLISETKEEETSHEATITTLTLLLKQVEKKMTALYNSTI